MLSLEAMRLRLAVEEVRPSISLAVTMSARRSGPYKDSLAGSLAGFMVAFCRHPVNRAPVPAASASNPL